MPKKNYVLTYSKQEIIIEFYIKLQKHTLVHFCPIIGQRTIFL